MPPGSAPVLGESDATEKKGKLVGGSVNCWPLSVKRSAADCARMYGGAMQSSSESLTKVACMV